MVSLSATAKLRQRAADYRREGREVFDFSAGELDLPTPAHIVEAVSAAAAKSVNHHYGPTAGTSELRNAVASRVSSRYPQRLSAANVLITNGAKQALFNTFMTLLQPRDEVLIPAPYWVTFPTAVTLAGGTPVTVPPTTPDLTITTDDLEKARTPATKAIILCSPNNPTGKVYDQQNLAAILGWAAKNDLWVVADETYVDLAFGPVPAPALLDPRFADRIVTVGGVSKSFAMTGWRLGWMIGPPNIITTATAVQSHTTSNVSGIVQAAGLAALTGPDVTADFRDILARRLALCESVLAPLKMFDLPPDGAFYIFPNITHITPDDVALSDRLLEQGVVTVPGSSFGTAGRLRLSFAIADSALVTGLQRLAETVNGRQRG